MELVAVQRAEQRQVLSPAMRQSLHLLQMPLPELRDCLQDQILANPLLELDSPCDEEFSALPDTDSASPDGEDEQELLDAVPAAPEEELLEDIHFESVMPDYSVAGSGICDAVSLAHAEEDFTDQLLAQLTRMRWLSDGHRHLAAYLIECLDENGYLRFDLAELAAELHTDLSQLEQALYVVQSLEPAGVGARGLTECLLLQLAQGSDFNAYTVHLVQNGLELLARANMPALAKLLGCTRAEAQQAANAVRRLNPIPSRGYSNGRRTQYQVPEAVVLRTGGHLQVQLNRGFVPTPTLNRESESLLSGCQDAETVQYLQQKTAEAKQLIDGVENRFATIDRILKLLLTEQEGYFLRAESLRPLTMSKLAGMLDLSTSTVSRAIQGKSILFEGKNLQLKSLFATGIDSAEGELSSAGIKQQLFRLLQSEDSLHPMSDERLRTALAQSGSEISRRTVAKYREELGIPAASRRRACE